MTDRKKKEQQQIMITGVLVAVLILIVIFQVVRMKNKYKKPPPPPPPISFDSLEGDDEPAIVDVPEAPDFEPRDYDEPKSTSKDLDIVTGSAYDQLKAEARKIPLDRDPFTLKKIRHKEEREDAGPIRIELELVGIAWDPVTPKAIINNKIVKVGSTIGPYTVLEITQEQVTLSDGNEQIELFLEL